MSDGNRENTTASVQIEEIKCTIRALPFVTKLSPVREHNGHGDGWGVSLRCFACEEYDSCGKKQESPVQISSRHPTELACLQELLKRLQDRHGECAQAVADAEKAAAHAPNVMQAMMLFQQAQDRAKAAQDRAKAAQDEAKVANNVAVQAEKDNDAAQKLQRVMEPKRARKHAATTDDDEECEKQSCDNWDLPDHRREATRIQNRHSIPLGSRGEVPTPQEGKAGPLEHSRLGFVGGSRVGCRG